MFCPNCGKEVDENASFCPNCGTDLKNVYRPANNNNSSANADPFSDGQATNGNYNRPASQPNYSQPATDPTNSMAIAGFVCSFFVAILGLIFGCMGLSESKKLNGKGYGFSIAAIAISIVSMVISVICVIVILSSGYYYPYV